MLTTERQILKTLQRAQSQLPDSLSKQDGLAVIQTSNAAIAALIEAEEPINKTQRYHDRAKHHANRLLDFIDHRQSEQWCEPSTYPYETKTDQHKQNA